MQQSIEKYEQILEDKRIDEAIAQAKAEYNNGAKLLDAKEVLSSLRRKHFK
ncbi:MAG: hypothetical protein FD141_151 [Fusobacteria bacterium]|nr:MAG: hypothetical protein FD141_151 [Fusobacteriota bacterium]KAF0229185.1 MAG: hypothetical protein FD182_1441 [Fusobacteriota bacterium]